MKKYIYFIIINFISLLIGLWLYFCIKQEIEILWALIATGISLSLGITQYKIEDDKMFKELFKEFNTKYDDKFNDKLEGFVNKYEKDKDFKLSPKQEQLVIDYLNLCAEEYLWKTKGRIPNEVWSAWENGMVYYLNKPIINKVILREMEQKDSYYGLFEKIHNRIYKPIRNTL